MQLFFWVSHTEISLIRQIAQWDFKWMARERPTKKIMDFLHCGCLVIAAQDKQQQHEGNMNTTTTENNVLLERRTCII